MESSASDLDVLLDSAIGLNEVGDFKRRFDIGTPPAVRREVLKLEQEGDLINAESAFAEGHRPVEVADAVVVLASKGQLCLRSVLEGTLPARIGPISPKLAKDTAEELVKAAVRSLQHHHQGDIAARVLANTAIRNRLANNLTNAFPQFEKRRQYKSRF